MSIWQHTGRTNITRRSRSPERSVCRNSAVALIEGIGFSKLEGTRDSGSYERKIVEYADQRVGPYGILSLDERIEESAKRYAGKHPDIPRSAERFAELVAAAHELERQLFSHTDIKPEDITDTTTAPLIEELRNYSVA